MQRIAALRFVLMACVVLAAADAVLASAAPAPPAAPAGPSLYAAWKNGPSADPNYFPIAVWLQDPKMAPKFKAAGINLYVGLWKGPTDAQLAELKAAGMSVICDQNAVGLAHKNDPTIVGWMHGDEPDNAQDLPGGKGYGPPIEPAKIIADYERMRAADPTRPVLLNLGQGVAFDNYIGRGVRRNHPEDYPQYVKGGDIVSFDIYPVAGDEKEVQGKLWYVARGVERLAKWAGDRRAAWNCIECTRIQSGRKATPAQVRAEVWMSLIFGSRGIIYFAHEWKPKFNEHALLDDPEMLAAVTAINKEVRALAPALNSPGPVYRLGTPAPPDANGISASEVAVAATVRRSGGDIYLFAVNLREDKLHLAFPSVGAAKSGTAEVIGENRSVPVRGGVIADAFEPYAVHLYRTH